MSSKPVGGDRAPKKQKTDEKAEEEASKPELNEAEKKLEDLQEELDKLEQEAAEEIISIQKKFNQKKKPVYDRRAKVIAGIPGFWAKAISNHQLLNCVLTEEDTKVFQYLESLDVTDFEDIKLGFRIEFRFKPNPWFKNPTLYKEFRYTDEGEFDSVRPCQIEWKEGKDMSIQNVDEANTESFFSFWFDARNEDTEVAEMIKEIFASPAKYYHNLVPPVESGSDDDDLGEDEGESGEEGEEGEGDEEDE